MRVLITGKSSFIGGAVARHAAGRLETELVSVRGEAWKSVDFSRYDCVLHAAGMAHVGYKDENRLEYMAVNRDLTLEVARRAKAAGVKHFIFLSSIIVYGPAAPAGKTRLIDAYTRPDPENAYGMSKLDAEIGLSVMNDAEFTVTILRLPMVWGEGCRGNYALLKKYARLLPVFPALCGRRSAINVDELAEYIIGAVCTPHAGIYFPASAEPFTTPDVLKAIRAGQGKKTHITRFFNPFIRMFGKSGTVRRIFGGLEYSEDLRLGRMSLHNHK